MSVNDTHDSLFIINLTSILRFCTKLQKYNISIYQQKLVTLGYSYIASAVRALVVKINNTSARRWRALISRWGSAQARLAPITYRLPASIIDSRSKSRGRAEGVRYNNERAARMKKNAGFLISR